MNYFNPGIFISCSEEDPLEVVEELLGIEDSRIEKLRAKFVGEKITLFTKNRIEDEMRKIEHARLAKRDDFLYQKSYDVLKLFLEEVEDFLTFRRR